MKRLAPSCRRRTERRLPPGSVGPGLAALAVLALAFSASSGFAQIGTANLSVRVVGTEGNPLPGVTVEAVNHDTGLERRGLTDSRGEVLLVALPPGQYEISASLEGMSMSASRMATLRVGHRVELDLTLQPQVSEGMTVLDEVPLVDVHRMDSSTNIVPEQIESLPVLDRQYERLAFLTPGVQRDRARFFNRIGAPGDRRQRPWWCDGLSHRWCRLDRQLHRSRPDTGEPGRDRGVPRHRAPLRCRDRQLFRRGDLGGDQVRHQRAARLALLARTARIRCDRRVRSRRMTSTSRART